MLADYRATYHPETPAEQDLVDQMVSARWRIRRLWTIETALIDTEICRRQAQVNREFKHIDGGIELALAFQSLADNSRALALVSRYESRLSRMHDRTYAALRELQNARQNKKTPNEPTAAEKPSEIKPLTADPIPDPVQHPRVFESETLNRTNLPGNLGGSPHNESRILYTCRTSVSLLVPTPASRMKNVYKPLTANFPKIYNL